MTTTNNSGAASTSKYAAKVAANRAAAVEQPATDATPARGDYQPRGGYNRGGYNRGYQRDYQPRDNYQSRGNYAHKTFKPKRDMAALAERFNEHVVRLASIVKNNSEIRRFTALGILNYLLQKGEISGDSRYVQFKWDKFGVKANGIMREYRYTEPFFLNALVASFTSFAASSQSVIDKFCVLELNQNIEEATNADDVAAIIESNKSIETDAPFVAENAE